MAEKRNRSKALRILVLILGTLLALFFLLAFVPKIITILIGTAPELPPGQQWEGHVMTAMFLIFMIGYTIGWWRKFWGGTLILLAAFVVCLPFIIFQNNYGSLIFGIPQFVIGILYLLLYWNEKRKNVRND